MDPLITSYLQAKRELQAAREKLANTLTLASENARPVGALRVATASDIREGVLFWYKRDEDGDDENTWFWCIVEDVLRPNDLWKAFTAHDGCRYGLDGAMVEVP